MLTFIFDKPNGSLMEVVEDQDDHLDGQGWSEGRYIDRHDFLDFVMAESFAVAANNLNNGYDYLAIDAGAGTHPRFDVIKAPQIGDAASYGFNGDYYPDGVIAKISNEHFRVITTSTGARYYRHKLSAAWTREGGTFSLVHGRIERRNQER